MLLFTRVNRGRKNDEPNFHTSYYADNKPYPKKCVCVSNGDKIFYTGKVISRNCLPQAADQSESRDT